VKTRILHTRFWRDGFVCQLNYKEKLLFAYLLTNDKINLIGIYELPDKYIKMDLDLSQADLDKAKDKLQKAGRVIFKDSWIKVTNVDKYNSYRGEKLQKARERELSEAPEKLIEYQGGIDTSIHTSIYTPNNHKSKTINHKSKTINHKSKTINHKSLIKNYKSISDLTEKDFQEIAEKYNVGITFVRSSFDDLKNYCGAHGRRYKNYRRALMNFVKKDAQKKGGIKRTPTPPPAYEHESNMSLEEREKALIKMGEVRKKLTDNLVIDKREK